MINENKDQIKYLHLSYESTFQHQYIILLDSCDGSKFSSDLQNLGDKDAENEDQVNQEFS